MGPVEYVVLRFPHSQFHGEIAPALARLIEERTVRILDLLFLRREADGSVVVFEYDELEELAAFADLPGEAGGLIDEQDISYLGVDLDPGAAAVVIMFEDLWATEFAAAVQGAGGVLVEGARIPAELIERGLAALELDD